MSMGFPRQEYQSGLHALLQGLFPTQGWNPRLLHRRQILYCLNHQATIIILLKHYRHPALKSFVIHSHITQRQNSNENISVRPPPPPPESHPRLGSQKRIKSQYFQWSHTRLLQDFLVLQCGHGFC